MDHASNPDSLVDSPFDLLNDYALVYLFTKYTEKFNLSELRDRLKTKSIRGNLARITERYPDDPNGVEATTAFHRYEFNIVKPLKVIFV